MLSAYPACFFKEKNGYTVIFPDLNWLCTCGKTLDEALNMAIDCLAGFLYSCKRENETLPIPSNIENIDINSIANELHLQYTKSFINVITVDFMEYAKSHFEKSVKKTLTIPLWLNNIALENNINFSQVLQDALKKQLHLN